MDFCFPLENPIKPLASLHKEFNCINIKKSRALGKRQLYFNSTIKFTSEISKTEMTFLDTKVYKGVSFNKESILDVQTH